MLFLQFYDSISLKEHESSHSFRPLHIASRCPSPPELFTLIMQVFLDEAKEKDSIGDLPLSIACSDPVANRSFDFRSKIQMLVPIYPDTVQMKDSRGRLPIFTALESGVLWEEGVSTLLELAPRALFLRDPVTGLYPFMLAACGTKARTGNDGDVEEGEEAKTLSSIFRLLRSDPSLLALELAS